jgi:transposase
MKGQTTIKKRRRYDADFKKNILKMIEDGRSVSSISESFGVSEGLLYRWKSNKKKQNNPIEKDEKAELKQLRKRLKEVEMERDILKKALSIFSRQI